MRGWDRGIDYESFYELLLRSIARSKHPRSKCYSFILLVQLRNGLRISEAVRAFKEFLLSGRTELDVLVSKKRRPETRKVVIPTPPDFDPRSCVELATVDERGLRERVRSYARRRFKINTHSLRYAFITYLLRRGVSPSIVAKITRHSKLDFILSYTQEKAAEDIIRSLG